MGDAFLEKARILKELGQEWDDINYVRQMLYNFAGNLSSLPLGKFHLQVHSGASQPNPITGQELDIIIKKSKDIHDELKKLKRFEMNATYNLINWFNKIKVGDAKLYSLLVIDEHLQEIVNSQTVSVDKLFNQIIKCLESMKESPEKMRNYGDYFKFIKAIMNAIDKKVEKVMETVMAEQKNISKQLAGI